MRTIFTHIMELYLIAGPLLVAFFSSLNVVISLTLVAFFFSLNVVISLTLVALFSSLNVAISLTLDGWSNRNLKGFYVMIPH